ncbi:hypothetical protein EK904_005338 [Melospiza melodia maxima]|nr:hypothetical protein EK904_005338 [Melospiza melodia maxima]
MWGISEEQEELEDHAGNAHLWIPDPAHGKARKETFLGILRDILTEVDASSDPVSHHPFVPHPPLCSFPSTVGAEQVGCVNRERAHHIYRNCLPTLATLANPKPLLHGLFNQGVSWQVFHSVIICILVLATVLGVAPVGGEFGCLEPKGN